VTERTVSRAGAPAAAAERPARGGLALAVIVTCQLMLLLDVTVMNVALPHIQHDLHFSPTGLSWVLSSYTLTYGGLLLLGGRAGDILGRRRTFVGGLVLFTLASLAGGLATSAAWLLGARIAQGVGAALAGPSTIALITTTFTDTHRRIRALAVLSGVAAGGFAVGLIIGGLLTDVGSWRWVMFINVPFGVAAVLLAPRYVKEPERHRARLDPAGAVLGTAGMGLTVYALIRAAASGWGDAATLATLGSGVVLLVAFVAVEARIREPLMPLRLFADRNRAAGYALFFLGPAANMSIFFFLTQFMQDVRGYGPLSTGFAFLPLAAGMFIMTRAVPRMLPRFGPKRMAMAGTPLVIGGITWLTTVTPSTGYVGGLLGPMLLIGFGGGLSLVPLNAIIMARVEPRDAGAAGGVLQTMQQSGSSLGLAVLVTVFGTYRRDALRGGADSVHAMVAGMNHAFWVSAALAACMFVVAATFRRSL
jgi:EmrB/QacA subfamily drug resistance transporter